MPPKLIENVSDTARWVAAYRAEESERQDALFRDPLAARLAGEKGVAIVAKAPRAMRRGWPIVTRTKIIDDLIQQAVAEGADLILNLAAGLDTRPYRLELPVALRWVEADFPALIEEKEACLAGEKPRCQLTRVKIDLSDPKERDRFLLDTLVGVKRALVITEGLLLYLDPATVTDLTNHFAAHSSIHWWITDLSSPAVCEMVQKDMKGELANAPFKFAPVDGVAFFERLGWKAREVISIFHQAIVLRRVPLWMRIAGRLAPKPNPRAPKGLWSAVVMFVR
jgi:methyltransferase (TIGR00027 family)